jgi:hypothetical protein
MITGRACSSASPVRLPHSAIALSSLPHSTIVLRLHHGPLACPRVYPYHRSMTRYWNRSMSEIAGLCLAGTGQNRRPPDILPALSGALSQPLPPVRRPAGIELIVPVGFPQPGSVRRGRGEPPRRPVRVTTTALAGGAKRFPAARGHRCRTEHASDRRTDRAGRARPIGENRS